MGQARMGLHVLQGLKTKTVSLSPPKTSQSGKAEEKRTSPRQRLTGLC